MVTTYTCLKESAQCNVEIKKLLKKLQVLPWIQKRDKRWENKLQRWLALATTTLQVQLSF